MHPLLGLTLGTVGGLLLMAACLVGLRMVGGPERVAEIALDANATAIIWAEGEMLYEPPGYLTIEVRRGDGGPAVPPYPFQPIGPKRVPGVPFELIGPTDNVAGLRQGNEIAFLIDLQTAEHWPPRNWDWSFLDIATFERLRERLGTTADGLGCERVVRFEEQRDRRARQAGRR